MDFKDSLKTLADRVEKLLPNILTEEATKNALIMPFIQMLGYDVFNPLEVNPEYVADIGIKKGEKVDYAIMKDGQPIILIECKHHLQNLDVHNSQLFRYFHTSKARFGILTNGITYRFYTDLQEPNKMDEKPFLEFCIREQKEQHIEELKKFHKSYFNIEQILSTASELKYAGEMKSLLSEELHNPSPEFVRYFGKQVYKGMITEKVLNQFTQILKKASSQLITDMINERLKAALQKEEEQQKVEEVLNSAPVLNPTRVVETTEEEKEAFFIIKSILRNNVAGDRITYRDAQTYCAILLDDNNRKPIARLYFNSTKKVLAVFDNEKKEVKYELKNLDGIYEQAQTLVNTVLSYESAKTTVNQ